MLRNASFSPPMQVPSPPPPSPSSPSMSRPTSQVVRRNSKRAVFDIVSTSPPESFDGQDKAILKERLERSRRLRIAVKPGVPARLLSDKEAQGSSSSSSSGIESGQQDEHGGEAHRAEAAGEDETLSPSSPWITDSESPAPQGNTLTTKRSQDVGGEIKREGRDGRLATAKKEIRIEGFNVQNPADSPAPLTPSTRRPPFSRTTSATTSSLSLLLARTSAIAPLVAETGTPATAAPEPTTDEMTQNCSTKRSGRTWNGDSVAEKLASRSRPATPSSSPVRKSAPASGPSSLTHPSKIFPPTTPSRTHSLASSASLPSLARASSMKRTRFLTPSASVTSTPSSSPPRSSTVLQFTRSPMCTRQNSKGGHDLILRKPGGTSLFQQQQPESESDLEETEVEEISECDEVEDFNRFQPSIFATHYSNSATSLSSMSSSTLRDASSVSSSPKSTRGYQLAASVPNVSVTSPDPVNARRVSSEPKRVDLKSFRREQVARKEKTATGSESSLESRDRQRSVSPRSSTPKQQTRRNTSTAPVSPTSLPYLQVPWKKLFSHN
ncbi:hypothetical protein JCM3766R1_003920 [Sporobolomyces carnicolor]